MKRIAFVLLAACAFVLATAGVAFANFGPHGGYAQDTDACAGCHRAHTSFSSVTWEDPTSGDPRSALLVSDAANMTDFCYACHGDAAPGASTNVQSGIFDDGPTDGTTGTVGVHSNSAYNETLNGGGFERIGGTKTVMSAHDMEGGSTGLDQDNLVRWGYLNPQTGLSDVSAMSAFTCASCHDPHGSSNYRLLKDRVGQAVVGGYDSDNSPNPVVLSNEQGYPDGGFRKGQDGADDVDAYRPNYTADQIRFVSSDQSISKWCSACHSAYDNENSDYDYGVYETATDATTVGSQPRHRHPVNVPLTLGTASDEDRALMVKTKVDKGLPLDMQKVDLGGAKTGTAQYWTDKGYVGCLTCHRAHGTEADMSGWAVAKMSNATSPPVGFAPVQVAAGTTSTAGSVTNPLGVAPNYSQSLLRYDNRGVCERCHDK